MVTLTFTCASMAILREEMAAFLNPIGHTVVLTAVRGVDPQQTRTEIESKLEEASPTPDEPKKRTRRTKAEVEAAKAEKTPGGDVFEPQPITAPAADILVSGKVSREAVHQALQQVNATLNLTKSREILQSFGANRISEIKEDQFKAFVDKCNEAVMMHA